MENIFRVGDKLVVLDASNDNREIFEVDRIGANGEVYDSRWRRLYPEFFRLATRDEIEANQRSY